MTSPALAITLDIGGSAAKAYAYDVQRGRTAAMAAAPYAAPHLPSDPGMFEPDRWWLSAVAALRVLRDQLDVPGGSYAGVTVSAIRIPFVLLGRDGDVVMPGLLNKDRRAEGQVAELAAAVGQAEIYRQTGHWLAPEFGLAKMLWNRERFPGAWARARHLLQLHDWFIYKLSGTIVSEPSSAAMSQSLDVTGRSWAGEVLSAVGIKASLFPELVPAGSVAGGLRPGVAAATGLPAGLPVHVGGGDTHLSAASAQGAGRASKVVVAGTTAPAIVTVPRDRLPRPTASAYPLLVSEHVVAGQWALEANAGFAGGVLAMLDGLAGLSGAELREQLTRRGMALRDGDNVMVLAGNPHFGPDGWQALPPPTVIGLQPGHTGADVRRAALRCTCFAIRSILGTLASAPGHAAAGITATGGMSRDAAWAQLLADVTGTAVRVFPLDQIAGRAGAALIAQQPAAPADGELIFSPRPDRSAELEQECARYQAVYREVQREVARPGSGGPCWHS